MGSQALAPAEFTYIASSYCSYVRTAVTMTPTGLRSYHCDGTEAVYVYLPFVQVDYDTDQSKLKRMMMFM